MTLEDAMVTALEYERKVRDHYEEAARLARNDHGRSFFDTLAREEQGHVAYLEDKLETLRRGGPLQADPVPTVLPSEAFLAEGVAKLKKLPCQGDVKEDSRRLSAVLRLEEEVSAYYKSLVESLEEPEGKAMFERFLEIEDGHTAIVRAEVDLLASSGTFYDFQEFNMEH